MAAMPVRLRRLSFARRAARAAAAAAALLAAACGLRAGELRPDPWPRQPSHWRYAPRPDIYHRQGATLVALDGDVAYEGSRILPGVLRVRVARQELDPRPSFAVDPSIRPDVAGTDAEIEAALRDVVSRLQVSEGACWRWFARLAPGESIFGLGERPGTMHQRGRRAVTWNTEQRAYSPDAERLHQSIPFWISLHEGRARGWFVDNTYKLGFDVGARYDSRFEVDAEAGDFDVYVIEGPSPREVVERFAALTGKAPMPPRWALGYHQSCATPTAQGALDVARSLREARIPCDALHVDARHQRDFRAFTVDPRAFPDLAGAARGLGALGFRLVASVDPGMKVDPEWAAYREARDRGYFVKTEDGDDYVGETRAGEAAFPDFTRDDVRAWWGALAAPLIDAGVAGIENDRNEPAVLDGPDRTMPEANVHQGWQGGQHRRYHNVYGSLMAQAAREAVAKRRPESRPFVLTRAAYAGAQRHAATWTGDNQARWPELRRAIAMTLNLGLSGQPFAGADVGGYVTSLEEGGAPFESVTPELHARWLEFGALLPFARSRTDRGSLAREPYAYGEPWTSLNRTAIERRYRLMPLIYTLAEEACRTGAPIARPLLWVAPGDAAAVATEDEFLLGDDLLVAPALGPDVERRSVFLPEGTWYRFDPCAPMHVAPEHGPKRFPTEAPIGRLPMYARGGSVVPTVEPAQHAGEAAHAPLTLDVFAGVGESELYEDAGDGMGYLRGEHARTRFRVKTDGGATSLSVGAREGAYVVPRRRVAVRFHEVGGIRETSYEDDGGPRELRSDTPP